MLKTNIIIVERRLIVVQYIPHSNFDTVKTPSEAKVCSSVSIKFYDSLRMHTRLSLFSHAYNSSVLNDPCWEINDYYCVYDQVSIK